MIEVREIYTPKLRILFQMQQKKKFIHKIIKLMQEIFVNG